MNVHKLRLLAVLLLLALVSMVPVRTAAGSVPGTGKGKVFLTVAEALELAFPECEIERQRVFLKKEQLERARKLSRVDVDSRIVRPYVARKDGKLVGTAYFDSHRVRTHRETLMIVVGPDARIRRIELLAFAEPEDYIPSGKWYAQFLGKKLDENLSLKRDIRGITGATLTARATTDAARRSLALHAVCGPKPPAPTSEK